MKNILITGGCGFIGSNFIRYALNEAQFEGRIINLDKLTYAGNPLSLSDIEQNCPEQYQFIRGDICDRPLVDSILTKHGIDTICHFAAESHVDRSIAAPDDFIQTNILGTYTLLEAARALGDQIQLFHHISTDEVFGSLGADGYFLETTAYKPNSPYSASKASSDHLVRAYHKTYDLPITISNCSNNYGPYQFPEKLIPLMILNAMEYKPLPIYGDGQNIRDWLYVRDHCTAIWTIMQHGRNGRTYNVGGRNEMANLNVVQTICDIVDDQMPGKQSRREHIQFVKDRPGHDRRYAIDCSRIEQEMGWRPEESFESGIRKTVTWYATQRDWIDGVRSGDYKQWIEQQYG